MLADAHSLSEPVIVMTKIPTEVHLAFLGRTIEIHWGNHALLMTFAWFVLVPVAILAIRYFKPLPTPYGIGRDAGRFDRRLLWWTIHWTFLYAAIGLALVGTVIAVVASRGYSGSVHAVFGLATTVLGCLQIVSAWLRGSHGGKEGAASDPERPETWHGDHYDMTPRRRWFEAYHRAAGHVTLALALAAVATGLLQYWVPAAALIVAIVTLAGLALTVLFEGLEMRQDTYRSVYGNHPEHPYNKARAVR
ncbi:MAG: hypothetical protein AMXMBFR66_10310 [Pseudomonadota bacterium]